MLDESILTSIKKLIGITEEDTSFDQDITTLINAEFLPLAQIGIGPTNGFFIEDDSNTWDEFSDDEVLVNSVKTYIYLKVKLTFDPPASSTVAESMRRVIDQLEWRMQYRVENPGS